MQQQQRALLPAAFDALATPQHCSAQLHDNDRRWRCLSDSCRRRCAGPAHHGVHLLISLCMPVAER
jgi:hypothetical protein